MINESIMQYVNESSDGRSLQITINETKQLFKDIIVHTNNVLKKKGLNILLENNIINMARLLEEENLNFNDLLFIDTTGKQTINTDNIICLPKPDLSQISLELIPLFMKHKKLVIIIDNLSRASNYYDTSAIADFIEYINNKIQGTNSGLIIITDESCNSLMSTVSRLVDKSVHL